MNSQRYRNMLSNHPEMVQAVPAMPQDNAAWSGSNCLGNVVDYGPDANNRQLVLKLDEWGPPEMWTISLGIDSDNDLGVGEGFAVFEIRAHISLGCGGATQDVIVDWKNGTQLTVPMNAVSVTAEYFNSNPLQTMVSEGSLRLSVVIARGTRASAYPPSVTLFFPEKTTAGTDINQSFILPRFAHEIEVLWPFSFSDPFGAMPSAGGLFLGDGFVDEVSPIELTIMQFAQTELTTKNQLRIRLPFSCRAISCLTPDAGSHGNFYVNCYLGL